MNQRGGPHYQFFGGGGVVSPGLVESDARAATAAAAAPLRMLVAALRALESGTVSLCGVILVNAAPASALLAACRLTSSVRSTKA
jgi:hypothetical protein